jgi:hypothetical protein
MPKLLLLLDPLIVILFSREGGELTRPLERGEGERAVVATLRTPSAMAKLRFASKGTKVRTGACTIVKVCSSLLMLRMLSYRPSSACLWC